VDPVRPRPLAVTVVVLALAGCAHEAGSAPATTQSTTTTTSTTTSTTEPPTTTTTVTLPDPVPVAWRSCGGGLDCATVAVPVSYDDPTGPTLDLALVRNPADRPEQRIGTLVMNPGGPGASGVRRVARGFQVSPEVGDRFDIVGFDPRGVGQSTPISCGAAVPAFRATDLAPDTDAEAQALAAAARAVADECRASEGDRLAHLGSVEVAHDIEVIRRALGEDQLSFVGLSYGTFIGQLWADAYPSSVRALVLDGVLDPGAASATASLAQTDGIDAAFDSMDRACAADPGCPLAASGGLAASYDELARRLEAGAVAGRGVGPTQLAYAAFYSTYDSGTWPRLWDAVARGLGGDLGGVAELAADYSGLVPYPPFALITCLDSDHAEGYEAWEASGATVAARSARFGTVLANELLPCAYWPRGTYEPHEVVAQGAPPILVIGSTGDAATPYESAVTVAEHLDSGALLTVEIDGHVAIGDSACATERATRYLVELAVPEPGARC
jgi:pimeloyl-ACP methyl ester carboxylesterase